MVTPGLGETQTSSSNQAYLKIRAMIVSLQLPPASVIDPRRLSEEIGEGRAPVREALQRLAREMLVVISPRRGTFVSDMSAIHLQQAFELRLLLEPYVARVTAGRILAEELDYLANSILKMEDAANACDYPSYAGLDAEFHRAIARASQNSYAVEFIDMLLIATGRLWHYALSRAADQRTLLRNAALAHQPILDALRAHDVDRASQEMYGHIYHFFEMARGSVPVLVPAIPESVRTFLANGSQG